MDLAIRSRNSVDVNIISIVQFRMRATIFRDYSVIFYTPLNASDIYVDGEDGPDEYGKYWMSSWDSSMSQS